MGGPHEGRFAVEHPQCAGVKKRDRASPGPFSRNRAFITENVAISKHFCAPAAGVKGPFKQLKGQAGGHFGKKQTCFFFQMW